MFLFIYLFIHLFFVVAAFFFILAELHFLSRGFEYEGRKSSGYKLRLPLPWIPPVFAESYASKHILR